MKNMNLQMIELQKFRKGKRQVFVDFTKDLVRWKNKTYRLRYVKVGETHYPYVIIEEVKPLKEIKDDISKINNAKYSLKRNTYYCNDNSYYVIGIGYDAIKVEEKNGDRYIRYETTEGQYLLEVLVESING